MSKKGITTSLFILVVSAQIDAQFFDFFSDLRPFTYQTIRSPFQETTTKRLKPQRYNGQTQESFEYERDINIQNTRDKARRKTTTTPVYDVQFITTPKSRKVKNVTKNDHSNSNSNDNNRNYDYNNRRPWQDANVIDYTVRPYETTRYSKYTTYNPLYNRPGVRPAVVDNNRPPITNRPATQRPLAVYPRPTDASVIRFPEGSDTSPPVLTGPDEEAMTAPERRRYVQIAEKMCDKYKELRVKKVEAIPLLPSPDSVQTSYTECEVSSVPLVVGGNVSSIREFPHMALLGWTKLKDGGYSWKCGGSLVSDRYVLTAAHCSFQNRDNEVVSGAPRVVQLGSTYLDDTGALVVKVSAIIRHPKYTQSRSYYDIALVKLAKAVTFSAVVKPACLGVPPPTGEKVVATGWGRTEFGGDQSLELRSVSVPIWDLQDCRRVLGVTRKMPQGPSGDSQVCAGDPKGGKDTCQGDSGGPAQIQDGCQWRVVGVTSVGRSCGAPNTPALYAKVHQAFIAAQIFADQVNKDNDQDSGSYNQYSGFGNQNSGSNSQNSGFGGQNSGFNSQNSGYNNQNTGSYDTQNNERPGFGSNIYSGRQNVGSTYDNNRRNDGQYYDSNNRQNNNNNRNQNSNNRQTGNNFDNNNRHQYDYNNQESNDRTDINTYNSKPNVNKPTNYYNNNQRPNNNYENTRNNNGMITFDRESYTTKRPTTRNYFVNNDRNNDYYRHKEDYRSVDNSEDIIYYPEVK